MEKRESLCFQNKKPIIRNHYGAVVIWMAEGDTNINFSTPEFSLVKLTSIYKHVQLTHHKCGTKTFSPSPPVETPQNVRFCYMGLLRVLLIGNLLSEVENLFTGVLVLH